MGKVWDLDLPHNQLLVLLALADHADHEGNNVYPSLGLVAWKTGYSEQQVRRILKLLVESGILIERGRVPGTPTRYSIRLSAGKLKQPRKKTPSKKSPLTKCNPLHFDSDPLHFDTPTPDIPSLKNDGEPSIEPSEPISAEKPRGKADRVPAERMNPMKDAIALAFNWTWEKMTRQEKGIVQRAAKELCEANVLPEEIPSLYGYCKRKFTSFKPLALAGNVSDWRKIRANKIIQYAEGYIPVEERTSVLDSVRVV